jgi:hypothetical protein
MRDIERREKQEARALKRAAKEARTLRQTRVKHKKLKMGEHGDMRLFEDEKLGDDEAFQDGYLMTLNVVPPMCEPHILKCFHFVVLILRREKVQCPRDHDRAPEIMLQRDHAPEHRTPALYRNQKPHGLQQLPRSTS